MADRRVIMTVSVRTSLIGGGRDGKTKKSLVTHDPKIVDLNIGRRYAPRPIPIASCTLCVHTIAPASELGRDGRNLHSSVADRSRRFTLAGISRTAIKQKVFWIVSHRKSFRASKTIRVVPAKDALDREKGFVFRLVRQRSRRVRFFFFSTTRV